MAGLGEKMAELSGKMAEWPLEGAAVGEAGRVRAVRCGPKAVEGGFPATELGVGGAFDAWPGVSAGGHSVQGAELGPLDGLARGEDAFGSM
jgi:hypothetical protein